MEKKIRIYGREIKTNDGKKFVTFSYTNDGENFFKVKFTQSCENKPKQERGYYLIVVDTDNISLQKDEFGTIMWIRECSKCVRDYDYEKELEANRKAEVEAIFSSNI